VPQVQQVQQQHRNYIDARLRFLKALARSPAMSARQVRTGHDVFNELANPLSTSTTVPMRFSEGVRR
jgi:hypothetical protein